MRRKVRLRTHVSGDVADKDALGVLVGVVGLAGPPCIPMSTAAAISPPLPCGAVGARLPRRLVLPAAIIVGVVVVGGAAPPGPIRIGRAIVIDQLARRFCHLSLSGPFVLDLAVVGAERGARRVGECRHGACRYARGLVTRLPLLRLGRRVSRGHSIVERLRHYRLVSVSISVSISCTVAVHCTTFNVRRFSCPRRIQVVCGSRQPAAVPAGE